MTQAIQERLQALLQRAKGVNAASVTLGDYKVIDRGRPPYYVILPGPIKIENGSHGGMKNFEWTYFVEVFAKFKDDSYEALLEARMNAINQLLPYKLLGRLASVKAFSVTAGDNLTYVYPKGVPPGSTPPQLAKQRLTTITNTSVIVEGGDY